jgi:hypothetical protein
MSLFTVYESPLLTHFVILVGVPITKNNPKNG